MLICRIKINNSLSFKQRQGPPHKALAAGNAEYREPFYIPWLEEVQLSLGRMIKEEEIKKTLVCLA